MESHLVVGDRLDVVLEKVGTGWARTLGLRISSAEGGGKQGEETYQGEARMWESNEKNRQRDKDEWKTWDCIRSSGGETGMGYLGGGRR